MLTSLGAFLLLVALPLITAASPSSAAATAGADEIVLYAGSAMRVGGAWSIVSDPSAAGGARLQSGDAGAPKVTAALAAPASYVEATFQADAAKPYRLWIRGRAQNDYWANDSVYVQFSGATNASGSPVHRIGTSDAATVNLEDGSGAGLSGWGWQDNGYGVGVLGPAIYFAATGAQTLRIQVREDGLGIDQVVLSAVQYLTAPPGALKNDTTILPASGGSTGTPPPTNPPPAPGDANEIVLHAGTATRVGGAWSIVPDGSAAAGARLQSPDAGAPKVTTALAAPASYAELTFHAETGKPYRLWIRGRAQNDSWTNDSVYVQFSGATTASGSPAYRIGTSAATTINLEDGSGTGLSGWGWQDNGYGVGVLGPAIYFAATGAQTLRIQVREDGLGIDQVVLSAVEYLNTSPGALKNDTTILAATGGSTDGEPAPTEPPPLPPAVGDVVLYASKAGVRFGWDVVADATAAGGARLQNPNVDAAKVSATANPARYFELTFDAEAGRGYRLWMRGKAQSNSWANDSVYVQFSASVNASGAAAWRIGTTDATWVNIEESSGAGLSGWGWQDNGYGASVLGPLVYFASTGRQTLRVQVREDGLGIDQIVLSPEAYLTAAPGAAKNDATILPQSGGTSTGTGITIVHAPYLQQVSATAAVVAWATRENGTARVRYRTTSGSGSDAIVAATSTLYPSTRTGMGDYYQHVARLAGLKAATAYTYDVELNGVDPLAGSHRLSTPPAPGTGSMSFIAFGDSGTGSAAQQQLAATMGADTFDIALHAGDVAYGSTDGVGGATHKTMTDWFFSTYRQWLSSAPMFPSIGNHDSRASNYDGRPYLDAFVLPAGAAGGAYPDHAERYYSFDYGPVHFVALDTELAFQESARRAEQLAWLDADLSSSTAPWKIAYFHRSPFSAGGEHGSDLAVRSAFSPVFERHGVPLVISAHEHIYERTKPWRTGTSGTSVTYIVTGGGGGPLYAAGSAEWTAVSGSFHHYIKGTVTECTLTVDALTPAGAKADSVTLRRCGG